MQTASVVGFVVVGVLMMMTSEASLGVAARDSPLLNQIYIERGADKKAVNGFEKIVHFIRRIKAASKVPLTFSWSDCGSTSSLVHVTSVTLQPNPLVLPGNPQLGFAATVTKNLSNVVSMDLKVLKKVAFIWLPIPCIDNIGSCSYSNVCPKSTDTTFTCPPAFIKYGIPCKCPVAMGKYNLPLSPMRVDLKAPSGDYKINARLHDGATEIGCLNVDVSIS